MEIAKQNASEMAVVVAEYEKTMAHLMSELNGIIRCI
jgi:hypothetical protein